MEKPLFPLTLGKCLLAGLLTGLITAIIVLAFNVIYRGDVDLSAFAIVMPVSIFLAFPLINVMAGGAYYLFTSHLRRGRSLYSIIVLVVAMLVALITYLDRRSPDPEIGKFRGLLLGLEIIEGFMAGLILPFLASHPKIFLTDKEVRGEE